MKYLKHITMMTGHSRDSYRREIDPNALAEVAALLDAALLGEKGHRVRMPNVKDVDLVASQQGKALLATLYDSRSKAPILTTGVALRSTASAGLWKMLVETSTVPVERMPAPPAPWIADRIEIGAIDRFDVMAWSGDWARCLGWAWVDYTGADSKAKPA